MPAGHGCDRRQDPAHERRLQPGRPGQRGALDLPDDLGSLPDDITVHLDAGYDSDRTRTELTARNLHGRIAYEGEKAPIQASGRWHVERTHAWQNAFHRLARCYQRRATVANAFFDFADTIITVRGLIRRAWTTHRWDDRSNRRP